MHIKFLAHGTGSGGKAGAYLMGTHDHKGELRAGVEVLRGDPQLFASLADSLPFQQRYTSAVISWAAEEAPTADEIDAALDDFEKLAFAGLDRQDVHLTAVLHREDDGGIHIHILIPRVHLGTGKSLNVAPPGQRKDFDSLRNKWNHSMGWARPDDPLRKRLVQPSFDVYRDAKDPKAIKVQITEYLLGAVAQGVITNAAELRRKVVELGWEITRSGADHLSIKADGFTKAIRLKGELYGESWTVQNSVEREDRAAEASRSGRGGAVDEGAARFCQDSFDRACERRAEYNGQRYKKSVRTAEISHEAGAERSPADEAIYRHLVESVTDRRVLLLGDRARELGGFKLARQRDPAADIEASSPQWGRGHPEQRQGVSGSPQDRGKTQHERRTAVSGGAVNDGAGAVTDRTAGTDGKADSGFGAAIATAGAFFERMSAGVRRGARELRDVVRRVTERVRDTAERGQGHEQHDREGARALEHRCRDIETCAGWLAESAELIADKAKAERKAKGIGMRFGR
jgi:hypothetical protein